MKFSFIALFGIKIISIKFLTDLINAKAFQELIKNKKRMEKIIVIIN